MSPEMQTMFLNTYPPKLIATNLKALREQLQGSDQLHSVEEIAGPVPEILLEDDQISKEGKFLDHVNGRYLPRDLVLAALREEVDWVHSEGVCEIGSMDTDKSRGSVQESTTRRSKVRFNELHQLLNCSLQCHLSKQ